MTTSKHKDVKTFPQGGIHPADNKLSADSPIQSLPAPETAVIFLSQHIGAPAKPLVKVGDTVRAGQHIGEADGFISANVHSSVSGTVQKIQDVMDVSGYKKTAIVIKADGDEWADGIDRSTGLNSEIKAEAEEIRKKVHDAGIVGLGGAAFPSHVKLAVPEGKTADVLLVNAVECEPYLTTDHRLMLEKADEIIVGVRVALKAIGIERAIIGIESNKPDAIALLTEKTMNDPYIEVSPLKMQYPQGGERQLVKALAGKEIPPPPKGLPIDAGCVIFNVATIFAIYEAVQKNKPLFERVVCVTGKNVKNPGNFLCRVGTPISELIDAAGGMPDDTAKIVSGGPMMGKALTGTDIPTSKGVSGILLFSEKDAHRAEILPCIRCGKCVQVCPLGLEPYLLMALSERNLFDRAIDEKIINCCECACCSYICPSNRPLLDYIRFGKATVIKKLKQRNAK
ncbi:MAG: electron transport complex subunit RsxC [Candidatus Omnitrophota bacterium]